MSYFAGSLDGMRDAVALVRAALQGDRPATEAILDGCDPREVAATIAGYAAAATIGNHGGKEAALAWLADAQRQLTEAERGAQ